MISLTATAGELGELREWINQIQALFGLDMAYDCVSLWADVEMPERYLVAVEETGSWPTLFESSMETELESRFAVQKVVKGQVSVKHGRSLKQAENGTYLSVSDRTSEPGYGPELREEVTDILAALEYIPGWLGHYVGGNLAIPEEVTGWVLWNSPEAFQQSVPRGSFYEIRLFHRIG